MTTTVTAVITSNDEDAWVPIKCPNAIWEADDTVDGGGYWGSDADVPFTAFTGRRKAEHVSCR